MYASAQRNHDYATQCRYLARAASIVLFVTWLALVVAEIARPNASEYAPATYMQAAVLAAVFGGYAIATRKELLGSLMAIVGTAAFFVVEAITVSIPRDPNVAWFAVPGLLYLLARHFDHTSDRPAM